MTKTSSPKMLRIPRARNTRSRSRSWHGSSSARTAANDHVLTLQFPWHGYEKFVGTSCYGTTSLEFFEMALYPTYFWVGASRVHDKSDGAGFVLFEDRPTNGNKTLPTLRPLTAGLYIGFLVRRNRVSWRKTTTTKRY